MVCFCWWWRWRCQMTTTWRWCRVMYLPNSFYAYGFFLGGFKFQYCSWPDSSLNRVEHGSAQYAGQHHGLHLQALSRPRWCLWYKGPSYGAVEWHHQRLGHTSMYIAYSEFETILIYKAHLIICRLDGTWVARACVIMYMYMYAHHCFSCIGVWL